MLFTECQTLGDVIAIVDQVDFICVTMAGGKVDFVKGDYALPFLNSNRTAVTKWRPEYALCSTAPRGNVVSFVVYPKPQFKNARPSTPAAMAKRFNDATPAENRG